MEGSSTTVRLIREKLSEVVGSRIAVGVSDTRIWQLIQLYGEEEEGTNCALHTLLEEVFEEEDNFHEEEEQDGFVVFDREEIASAASGSMGCGSSQSSPTDPTAASTSTDPTAMLCDMCSIKFTLMTRKKLCCECSNYFCSTCLPREQGSRTRTCSRCRVLHKSPPLRGDLMKLRVKDLQHFLSKRQINIKACVEKKDLVELVVQHAGGEAAGQQQGEEERLGPRLPGSRSWEDGSIRVSDQVPLERASNFPQNYTDSSHRRDWFQEKFGPNSESSTPSDTEDQEVSMEEATPVERLQQSDSEVEETNVEELDMTGDTIKDTADDAHMVEADEIISVVVDDQDGSADSDNTSDSRLQAASDVANEEKVEEISQEEELLKAKEVVEEAMEGTEEVHTANPTEDEGAVGGVPLPPTSMAGARLGMPLLADQDLSSTPSSPRRFANQGMVYLSEIESVEDLRELSTKQIKELLAMNRVNFKGCVEKDELLRILERLWRQEQRHKEEGDTMDDDSLCKICMDSPIDCVMLECGHMCTCTQCGKQMAECPICRQYVVRVVKTFKA